MHPSFRVTDKRSNRSFELAGSVLLCALIVSACGGAFAERAPMQHRPGPAASYGAYATFTPQDLVHANTRGGSVAAARPRPDIDTYLLAPKARAAVAPRRPMAASPSPTPAPAPTLVASITPKVTPTQPAARDVERYAARERSASKQMQYRGGDVVIIGASTLIVILLVVILVLLLT